MTKVKTPLSLSKWQHLTVIYSTKENNTKIYLNGKLQVDEHFKSGHTIKPGKCRLGNWLASEGYEPKRSFKGRIDELILWEKALSQKDIQSLIESGRPSIIWSSEN